MLPLPMHSAPSLVFCPASTDSSACSTAPFLPALCFHILTNRFSRKPFVFTSIQNPRGVTPRYSYSTLIRLCGAVSLCKSHILSSLQPLIPLFALFSALPFFVFNVYSLFSQNTGGW